jgi:hypothetical protein
MRYILATIGVVFSILIFILVVLIVILRGLTSADEVARFASYPPQPPVVIVQGRSRVDSPQLRWSGYDTQRSLWA